MRDRVEEHDERHLLGVRGVVVLERLLDGGHLVRLGLGSGLGFGFGFGLALELGLGLGLACAHHLVRVRDLRVELRVGAGHHEVSVDEVGHVDLDDVRPLDREELGHEALEQVVEPG